MRGTKRGYPDLRGPFDRAGAEPSVGEMLRDPIVRLVMARDKVHSDDVLALMQTAPRSGPRLAVKSGGRDG